MYLIFLCAICFNTNSEYAMYIVDRKNQPRRVRESYRRSFLDDDLGIYQMESDGKESVSK